MAGTLYLVPTPIGNLNDISPRCARTLAEADFIVGGHAREPQAAEPSGDQKKPCELS